ncbi:hypothetical protein CBL_00340 [Carabus blaptoides fortunei]
MRTKSKSKKAKIVNGRNETGGGIPETNNLTQTENAVLDLMSPILWSGIGQITESTVEGFDQTEFIQNSQSVLIPAEISLENTTNNTSNNTETKEISTEPSQGHHLNETNVWHKLKQIHEGKVSSRRVDIRLELSSIKKGETEKLEQYLARAQYIRDQLSQCGAHIENEEYMDLILFGLLRAYNVIRLQMKATGLEKITEAEFRTDLKAQEEEIALADIETKMEATYLSKTQQKYNDEKKNKPDINCYVCGKRGLYARNCYRRADTRVRGHPRQQKEGQSSTSEQDEQRDRSKKTEKGANTTKQTPDNRAMRVTNKMGVQQTKRFIDSGATSHKTYNKRNFSEFEETDRNPVILPNGKTLQV